MAKWEERSITSLTFAMTTCIENREEKKEDKEEKKEGKVDPLPKVLLNEPPSYFINRLRRMNKESNLLNHLTQENLKELDRLVYQGELLPLVKHFVTILGRTDFLLVNCVREELVREDLTENINKNTNEMIISATLKVIGQRLPESSIQVLDYLSTFGLSLNLIRRNLSSFSGICSHGNLEVTKYLCSYGLTAEDILTVNGEEGTSPFSSACESGNNELVKYFLSFGLTVKDLLGQQATSSSSSDDNTPPLARMISSSLVEACRNNNFELVKCLFSFLLPSTVPEEKIDNEVSIPLLFDTINRLGNSESIFNASLFYACQNGNLEMVKYLFSLSGLLSEPLDSQVGSSVLDNIRYKHNSSGSPLLHAACRSNNLELVKYLFSFGLTVEDIRECTNWHNDNDSSDDNDTQYHNNFDDDGGDDDNDILTTVCIEGNLEMLKYFFSFGLGLEDIRRDDCALLVTACEHDQSTSDIQGMSTSTHTGIIRYLCSFGIVLDDIIDEIIFTACEYSSLETIKYLCSLGITLEHILVEEMRLVYISSTRKDSEVLDYFLSYGVMVAHIRQHNYAPLYEACIADNLPVVKRFLALGLTVEDLKRNNYQILEETCILGGGLKVLKYLMSFNYSTSLSNQSTSLSNHFKLIHTIPRLSSCLGSNHLTSSIIDTTHFTERLFSKGNSCLTDLELIKQLSLGCNKLPEIRIKVRMRGVVPEKVDAYIKAFNSDNNHLLMKKRVICEGRHDLHLLFYILASASDYFTARDEETSRFLKMTSRLPRELQEYLCEKIYNTNITGNDFNAWLSIMERTMY